MKQYTILVVKDTKSRFATIICIISALQLEFSVDYFIKEGVEWAESAIILRFSRFR